MNFFLGPTARSLPDANVGLGCAQCAFLTQCQGIYDAFDCLTTCCRKPASCKVACPLSERFAEFVEDAGGWGLSNGAVHQSANVSLPQYIPLLQHWSSRVALLKESVVALPTSLVSALVRQNPNLDGVQLREVFRLAPETDILLISVATDAELEGLWRDMKSLAIPSALARLRILHITSPNFSFPISLPRTESLTNRSRIVRASEQLSAAGLSVILHLNATHSADWMYWADFLSERVDIFWVSKEFQTGLKSKPINTWHMAQMADLQDRIGRQLGLLAVGGRGALSQLSRFKSLSVVDSNPFMRAANRHLFTGSTPWWRLESTLPGAPVDEHLRLNILSYRADLENRLLALRDGDVLVDKIPLSPMPDSPRKALSSPLQESFWPDMYFPQARDAAWFKSAI